MNIPYVMKRCTKCGRWLVANTINFRKNKTGKYGLKSCCKTCGKAQDKEYRERNKDDIKERRKEYDKKYREANKDKIAERHKQYYEANKDKIRETRKGYNKKYYEANKDKKKEYNKKWYEQNKNKIKENSKKYYEANKDKINERAKKYNKKWYEQNKDKMKEHNKKYYEANKDKINERAKKYREQNKDKIRERDKKYRETPKGQAAALNKHNKRKMQKQLQGSGITGNQWLEMMDYFDWKCAYSGKSVSKQDARSIDHIVPLNTGGEHEIWNLVPMDRYLNSSKNDKDMLEWYREQDFYSEARLAKIYEWQEYAKKKWKIS